MKLLRIIFTVMIIGTLCVTPVMAGSAVDVGITANPMFTAGITSFNITYISDTQMDLDWTVDATVDKVMVRAKYGGYPADIPNDITTPSDGYLVYYGNGIAVSDTSMDFDQNLGFLYYKAWAQKLDGTWYINTSTGNKESRTMVLILLVGFATFLSIFGMIKKNPLFTVFGAAGWLSVILYTRANPIGDMPIGSTFDNSLLLVFLVMMVAPIVYSWRESRKDNREGIDDDNVSSTRNITRSESSSAYNKRLNGYFRPNRRK